MSFTRAQYRTRTQQFADASGSGRWDDTAGATGEIDRLLGDEFDRSWRRILNANPYYRVSKRTPTSDSDGKYAISDLSSGSADSAERFYRVLRVAINNITYPFVQRSEQELLGASLGLYRGYYWFQEGQYLTAMPISASTEATGIWVNWIPPRIDNLSGESIVPDYPDGYEHIICRRAAARMLEKGGAEAGAATYLDGRANEMEAEMLQDVARISIDARQVAYDDTSADWGASQW